MMNDSQFAGLNGFVWWVGVVEDRQDPLKLGRCRVRIFGWHSENVTEVPTELLPWSQAMMPLNNSNTYTPKESDVVVGFFLDGGNAQTPVMMGVLPGIPLKEANSQQGFNDQRNAAQLSIAPVKPGDKKTNYPRHIDEPTTSRLARNENPTQIELAQNNVKSPYERNPAYGAKYPYNNVIESESGHAFEIDDSPGDERINIFHRTGSHLEMRPDGAMQQKIMANSTRLIEGDELVHIKGNKSVIIDGDLTYQVKGNVTFEVEKDFQVKAKNINLTASGKFSASAGSIASISGVAAITASSLGYASFSGTITDVSGTASLSLSGARISLKAAAAKKSEGGTTTANENLSTGAGASPGAASAMSSTSTGIVSKASGAVSGVVTSTSTEVLNRASAASQFGFAGKLNQPGVFSNFGPGFVQNIQQPIAGLSQIGKEAIDDIAIQVKDSIAGAPAKLRLDLGVDDTLNKLSTAGAKLDVASKFPTLKNYKDAGSAAFDAVGAAGGIVIKAEGVVKGAMQIENLVGDFCIGENAKIYIDGVKDGLKEAKEEYRKIFKDFSKSTIDKIEEATDELKTKMKSFDEKSIDEWIDGHLFDSSCGTCAQNALVDRNSGKTEKETADLLNECLYKEYKELRDSQVGVLSVTSADIVKAKRKEC